MLLTAQLTAVASDANYTERLLMALHDGSGSALIAAAHKQSSQLTGSSEALQGSCAQEACSLCVANTFEFHVHVPQYVLYALQLTFAASRVADMPRPRPAVAKPCLTSCDGNMCLLL